MIELTASDGSSFSAYRADPTETPKGAIVILQDIFGITPEIQNSVRSSAFSAASSR